MYWKRIFARPRPSRLDPALVPPIEVPGHGSYPSGHACEAMLVALILEQVLPEQIIPADAETGPLRLMARRIARNREVLGLHYPSDTRCGFRIAARCLPLFLACPTVRGMPELDGNGQIILDTATQNPINQAAEGERLQSDVPGFGVVTPEPVNPGGAAIYMDGLLARGRREWV